MQRAQTSEPATRAWTGECHLLFQFDIGQSVDLKRCLQLRHGIPARILQEHRAPAWFQFNPAPLAIVEELPALNIGRFWTRAEVSAVVYDFGALSLSFVLPCAGSLAELVELSALLQEEQSLRQAAKQHAQRLLNSISAAVVAAKLAETDEDYLIFQLAQPDPPAQGAPSLDEYRHEFARILRGERSELSPDEIASALERPVRYGIDDVAWIDWQAALLIGEGWRNVLSVLEFASVQLLELRYLDSKLDVALDRSYESLGAQRARLFFAGGRAKETLRVARLQVDAAILHERVSNTLKLLGDQYLARIYQLASRQFRLTEWNTNILRKLDTLDSIYQKLNDRADSKRMELLELIIILLIAIEMVLPLLRRLSG